MLVSQQGERLYRYAYGFCEQDREQPVTEHSVFKVASLTKLITAIGVMQLVEDGKLFLDAPLTDQAGPPVFNPRYPDLPITLRQVMSHTSSIKKSAPYTGQPPWVI